MAVFAGPRQTGHVKFFNATKGYGFIIPVDKTLATSADGKGSDCPHRFFPVAKMLRRKIAVICQPRMFSCITVRSTMAEDSKA